MQQRSVMQLLEANVRDSGLSHICRSLPEFRGCFSTSDLFCSVRELPWGASSWDAALPHFDVVLAADVVYR
jgi:hypothetical protein